MVGNNNFLQELNCLQAVSSKPKTAQVRNLY